MHIKKLAFQATIAVLFISCSPGRSISKNSNSFPNRYSLDKLPEDWKKPATLKAIDDILPEAISQLKNSQSCMNCNAAYSVTVHLDSLYILDEIPREKSEWVLGAYRTQTEITCKFKFKSHLSIEDSAGKEIVHLIIVDGDEDEYTIIDNPYSLSRTKAKSSFVKSASEKFGLIKGRPPLVPTDEELLNFSKQKLKVIQKRIQDLQAMR